MKLHHTGVLVIGLGPAGGAAALAAAADGAQVVAIDRRREIGTPVQCAEFVPLPLGRFAQAEGVLQQRIGGMTTILPSGTGVDSAFPGLVIDRAAFDRALAGRAAVAGAAEWLGTTLESVDAARRVATVLREGERLAIGYDVLVAADGPHSRVARCLGLPPLEKVDTRQYAVRLLRPHDHTDIWLSTDYPGGYAWLFPKGGVANLGVGLDCALAPDLKRPLDALHCRLAAAGRVGSETLARTGGAIPVGGIRAGLVAGEVVFAGDAAGLTHPITGAGIAAAVVSGESAGLAAARHLRGDGHALAEYEDAMREQFQTALDRAVERRREMTRYWSRAEARQDALHRRGWIAFPEYFAALAA